MTRIEGRNYLVTDTVGFIRKLPHGLVEAFAATLEETIRADLVLHVVDASVDEEELGAMLRAVDEVLEEVQLVPQSGQLPGTLSSGQRRRLALATAFVRPRRLLILDEPEQRLDVEGIGWLSRRLQAERQQGLAIVFASHEPTLVESVATRTVTLGAPRG